MSSRRARKVAWLAGLVITASGHEALAQHSCDGVRLELSDDLSPTWREAGQQLRTELVASDAPCVSATLLVTPATGGARLSATTPDGRHTERVLTRVATLVPTALGIVASLPPDPPSKAVPAPAPAPEEEIIGTTSAPADVDTKETRVPLPRDPAPQVWVGASAGARVAGPTLLGMMDVEGHVGLDSDRWLVLASFRYGTSFGESAVSTDDTYYELVGALGVGRRFPIGSSSLDILLLPALSSASLDDNDDQDGPPGHARIEGRIDTLLCWWTGFRDGSRVSLSVDGDLAPYGIFRGVRTQGREPVMPVWTAGIRLGASGRIL